LTGIVKEVLGRFHKEVLPADQKFVEVDLPDRFVVEVPSRDGGWIDYGKFARDRFSRLEDGSYLCAGEGWSPFYLRCVARHGPLLVVLDGSGERFVYRIRTIGGSYVLDTASGRRIDLQRPRSEDIDVNDVASALSKICRFGAQARTFYSVAQHAATVHDYVVSSRSGEIVLAALHHDSHEAFACDIPTPVKRLLRDDTDGYDELCNRLDSAIGEAFGYDVDATAHPAVKAADRRALISEAQLLLHDAGRAMLAAVDVSEAERSAAEPRTEAWAPDRAREEFLQRHHAAVSSAA
jgi:5'-deoxynucleotidase YfbR-like HD superfamily hydrolase